MDAILIAGGTPEEGALLYEYTQGKPKALLDICGKPMVQWVLDAITDADKVDGVVIIGLPEDCGITSPKIKAFIPDQGEMLDNIQAGTDKVLELNPQAEYMMIVSSDVPGVTAEGINWVADVALKNKEDVYYNVIERKVMEARYPTSKRSYVHLKDVEVCGGDVNVVRCSVVTKNSDFWRSIIAARKNALKQAAIIGFDTLILLLIRQITIQSAVSRVTRRVNLTGRAPLCPYAEIGMDVDKPHQLELMRADLAKRGDCKA